MVNEDPNYVEKIEHKIDGKTINLSTVESMISHYLKKIHPNIDIIAVSVADEHNGEKIIALSELPFNIEELNVQLAEPMPQIDALSWPRREASGAACLSDRIYD